MKSLGANSNDWLSCRWGRNRWCVASLDDPTHMEWPNFPSLFEMLLPFFTMDLRSTQQAASGEIIQRVGGILIPGQEQMD